MVFKSSRVSLLLSEILKSPTSTATAQLEAFIDTEDGLADLAENLRSGNPLAFIYLKQNISTWVSSKVHPQLYTQEFILFVLSSAGNSTRFYTREYLRHLSNCNLVNPEIISQLVEQRSFDMIASVTDKYTKLERSNELFIEIKAVIEQLKQLFDTIYFAPRVTDEVNRYCNDPTVGRDGILRISPYFYDANALQVIYNLLYQDIHPYFEDNTTALFKVLFVLFDSLQTRIIVLHVYDLFLTKYPDCADFSLLIAAIARADSVDSEIIEVVTKAFGYNSVNPEMVVKMLQKILEYELKESDMRSYTQNMLKGVDTTRGCAHRLIKLLFAVYKDQLPFKFDTENALFIATTLKFDDIRFVNLARQLVYTNTNNHTVIFTAFHYLIVLNATDQEMFETGQINEGLLHHLNGPCRFICLKYLSQSLKNKDNFYRSRLVEQEPTKSIDFSRILPLLLGFITEQADEFSTEMLLRIIKMNPSLLTSELCDFITNKFEWIDQLAILPIQHLFDIYISLSVKLKKYNLELVERILNNEMVDLFSLVFYYLSVLIQETELPRDFILNILRQDALWNERVYHLPLVLMLISGYKRGILDSNHLMTVCSCLSTYHCVLLLSKSGLHRQFEDQQAKYLVNGEFNELWFTDNFLDKRYCRMVIKKMLAENKVSEKVARMVIDRNVKNIEFETTLHSITEYFGL